MEEGTWFIVMTIVFKSFTIGVFKEVGTVLGCAKGTLKCILRADLITIETLQILVEL